MSALKVYARGLRDMADQHLKPGFLTVRQREHYVVEVWHNPASTTVTIVRMNRLHDLPVVTYRRHFGPAIAHGLAPIVGRDGISAACICGWQHLHAHSGDARFVDARVRHDWDVHCGVTA